MIPQCRKIGQAQDLAADPDVKPATKPHAAPHPPTQGLPAPASVSGAFFVRPGWRAAVGALERLSMHTMDGTAGRLRSPTDGSPVHGTTLPFWRGVAMRQRQRLHAANARLLGVVLSGRTFPIPEAIYRKL